MTNKQYFGWNSKSWNFYKTKKEGWMYIKSINFNKGWLHVVFTEGWKYSQEELKVRVAGKDIPDKVKELLKECN